MAEAKDTDHTAFEADFSDFYEKLLAPARQAEVQAHLDACGRCKAEYDKFVDALRSVSGLHRMSAPQGFEEQVEQTIHRRSAGRFFGRRALADRVPFELLALVGLVLGVAVYLVVRYGR